MSGEVCLRIRLDPYERAQLNGGPDGDYASEVESVIGVRCNRKASNGFGCALPAGLLEAFNAGASPITLRTSPRWTRSRTAMA